MQYQSLSICFLVTLHTFERFNSFSFSSSSHTSFFFCFSYCLYFFLLFFFFFFLPVFLLFAWQSARERVAAASSAGSEIRAFPRLFNRHRKLMVSRSLQDLSQVSRRNILADFLLSKTKQAI